MPNPQCKATSVAKTASPKRFVFLLLERFTMLSFAGAIEPLRIANRISGQPLYTWKLAGEGGDFAKVESVIHERCTVCHSVSPSSPMFSAAPAGLMLDTPEQMKAQAAKIHAQSVASQIMPLGNITQMTQDERDLIGSWIAKGAQIN